MKKKQLIISTLACLLPAVIGLCLWGKLPDVLPIHWNGAGEVDGTAGKAVAVFGLPLFLVAVHLFTLFFIRFDPRQKEGNFIFFTYIIWFVPVLCSLVMAAIYATALGFDVRVDTIIMAVVGLVFAGIGVMLKKVQPNYTIGIRLPWTLDSEENWNRTHAFASPVWVVGGLVMAASAFFSAGVWVTLAVVFVAILMPAVYSFMLYRKEK